jgi:uncharacterized protein YdeI (YjbR/CyaY-like superfamily)
VASAANPRAEPAEPADLSDLSGVVGGTREDGQVTDPIFFASPDELRAWFAEHAATSTELFVGYYKKSSGQPSLTWSEAVDEALCVGWIDGVVRRIDATRHQQRFTPRKAVSNWSLINIAKVAALTAQGRMQPAGLAAFERRTATRSGVYSFEQDHLALDAESEARLRADPVAWEFWERQPPGYRKPATWWVISAKRPETKDKRLAQLVADCAAGLRIKPLRRS